jgi:hypothetical protein
MSLWGDYGLLDEWNVLFGSSTVVLLTPSCWCVKVHGDEGGDEALPAPCTSACWRFPRSLPSRKCLFSSPRRTAPNDIKQYFTI